MYFFVVCILILYAISFSKKNVKAITKDDTAVLKAIMAVLIILHHISLQGVAVLKVFHSWGAPLVSIFFFLSGYGLMKSLNVKGSAYLSDFIVHRIIKGVLVTFIIAWGIFRALNFSNLPGIGEELELLIYRGIPVLPHSWFVFAIICFYIFFYVSNRFFARSFSFIVLILLVLLYCLFCIQSNYDRCWYISALGFPTGVFIGKYEKNMVRIISNQCIYYLVAPLCLLMMAVCVVAKIEILYMLVYILIPFVFATFLYKINLGRLMSSKFLKFLTAISFEMYLSQGISMSILRGNVFNLTSDIVYILCTLLLTVLIAVFIRFIRLGCFKYLS